MNHKKNRRTSKKTNHALERKLNRTRAKRSLARALEKDDEERAHRGTARNFRYRG